MTTRQDIELRISANDLGTQKLEELALAIDELRKSQEAYAASGDAATKSLRDLSTELADLKRIGQELAGRGALIDLFEKQQAAVAETSKRVEESRAAYEKFKASLVGTETVTRKQQTELSKLERGFASATKQFETASKGLEKVRGDLAKIGLEDTSKARASLVALANDVGTAITRSEKSIRSYDSALRAKRESERQAAESARQLAEAQKQAAAAAREQDTRRQFLGLARGALEVVTAARSVQSAAQTLAPAGQQVARALQAIADPAREATRQIDTLEKALAELEKDLKAAAGGDATAADNIRRQRNEYAAFARDATKAAVAVAETIDSYKRQAAALAETRQALDASRQKTTQYAAELVKVGVPTDELRRKLALAKAELVALTAQFARESAQVGQLGARLAEAGVDVNQLAAAEQRLAAVTTRVVAAQQALGAGAVRLGQANQKAAASFLDVADKGRKALSIYQRIRGQVLAMTSAYVGLFGVLRFAQSAITAVSERESTMVRLNVANNGDVRKTAQDFAFLRDQAERLGLALQPLAGQYSRFAIAASSANLTADQTRDTFLGFAEASRVFNLSVEDTQGVFRALEQVLSKGKVQAEELRGQLGDRLSGAFTTFAKALGLSNRELDKMLEKGEVSAQEIVKLAAEYRKTVAGQLEPATKTLRAELARLDNALTEFKINVANGGLAEIIRELTLEFTAFLRSAQGKQTAREIAEAFRVLGNVLLSVLKNFDALKGAVVALFGVLSARFIMNMVAEFSAFVTVATRVTKALATMGAAARVAGLAFSSIPFVALAVGVTALISAYLSWRTRTDEVAEANDKLQEAIVGVTEAQEDQKQAALDNLKRLRDERIAMLRAANAAYARAIAERELNDALDKRSPRGEPGEGAFRAGRAIGQESRIKELRRATDLLAQQIIDADKAIKDAENYVPPDPATVIEPTNDGVDLEALKKLQEERVRLEEEAVQAIIDARKELLGADEDNLQAQLELIDVEFGQRVLKIRQLQEELRAVNLGNVADSLEPVIETFTTIRNIDRAEAERNAKLRERKTLQDELNAKEEALNRLIEVRDARIQVIEAKRQVGVLTELQAQDEIARVQNEAQAGILARIQEFQQFIQNNRADLAEFLNIDAVLAGLEQIQVETLNVSSRVTKLVADMQESIAGGLTDSIVAFGTQIANVIRGTASLSDAFKSAKDTFLNFAADFLTQIAKMIIQQMILRALQSMSGLSGVIGSVAGMAAHTGAVVGHKGGQPRSIPAWMLATAPRYHSGTVVGLRPDERPAILQTGEEVLARGDPRNVMNGGGAQAPQQIKVVNMIDRESLAREVLSTPAAIKTISNVIRANKSAFKAALA